MDEWDLQSEWRHALPNWNNVREFARTYWWTWETFRRWWFQRFDRLRRVVPEFLCVAVQSDHRWSYYRSNPPENLRLEEDERATEYSTDVLPGDVLAFVFFLLLFENESDEQLLQLFITIVDTQLFKTRRINGGSGIEAIQWELTCYSQRFRIHRYREHRWLVCDACF